MKIRVLCNAGLALEYQNQILLVDAPNCPLAPYAALPEGEWARILAREAPYDRLCGLYFTHTHPDHCDLEKVREFQRCWPEVPCFLPENGPEAGQIGMGPFFISFARLEHAPMDSPLPPHVVTWIQAGETGIYIAADARLHCEAHQAFLRGRVADAAFWNGMYLSRPETRGLLREAARRNYIYHMPEQEPDGFGIWKKCRSNLRRYPQELEHVTVIDRYPWQIEV